MTTEEIQKLKEEAEAARAAAKVAADDAAANPGDTAKEAAAVEAEKRASDAEAAVAAAEAAAKPDGSASTSEMAHAPWWQYVSIGAAMAILLLGVSYTSRCVFFDRAERLTGAYKLAPSNTNTNSAATNGIAGATHRNPTTCPAASPQDKGNFILGQRAKIVELGDGHRLAAIEFGSYFFANIIILAVFGFISLISLLLITKRGITKAHGTLVAVFLLSSGIGLIYQGMYGVFQQSRNVDSNHTSSVEYGRLVDRIDTYCATGKLAISDPAIVLAKLAENVNSAEESATNSTTGKPKKAEDEEGTEKLKSFFVPVGADEFILYLEWKTEALRKFSISLDETSVQSLTDPQRVTGLETFAP